MNDTKLKPCPFCGGKATLRKSERTELYHVKCFKCGCLQDASYKAETVINAWNTRKPMDNIVEELESRKELLNMAHIPPTHKNVGQNAYNIAIGIVKAGGKEVNED